MNESFLHFIWKFKLYDKLDLKSTNGETIEVLYVGLVNNGVGPDFLNARVKINETEWVGNVEIHIKSTDWVQHKHNTDKAYDNVILHVVQKYDTDITRQNGTIIPTLVLQYDCRLEERYKQLLNSPVKVPCQPGISSVDSFHIRHFLSRVLVERLERKSDDIAQSLGNSKNNWREAFYQLMFRAFGFGINALPFQMLAQHTPLRIINKYGNNIFQIEALLFGQAGFLENDPLDDYQAKLKAEYDFLRVTYNLKPLDKSIWKFGRLRPANFPSIRIAQLAQLVDSIDEILEKTLIIDNIDGFFKLIQIDITGYWNNHYDFGKESDRQTLSLGKKSVEKLISNVIVPFLFTYGKWKGDNIMQDRALLLLESLPPESNSIIDTWNSMGVKADSAFYSQALIQLNTNYCEQKRCLTCTIGKIIIEKG